jgi:hypothetical protein
VVWREEGEEGWPGGSKGAFGEERGSRDEGRVGCALRAWAQQVRSDTRRSCQDIYAGLAGATSIPLRLAALGRSPPLFYVCGERGRKDHRVHQASLHRLLLVW